MHPHDSMFRTYVEGEASPSERQEINEHLKGCTDCRELLSFTRDFSDTAKDLAADEIAEDEPHPRNSVIIAYEEGRLDKETSLHLRSHMLFCDRCAETYYLLKRMRAPSWTDVVIETIRSAKETLLRAVEMTGMGELVPLPATASRGEPEEPQSRVEISQHVMDDGDEADVILSLEAEGHEPRATVRISVAIGARQPWTAKLLDEGDNELASVPLSEEKQVLHPGVAPGTLVVQVTDDEKVLAACRLKIQASDGLRAP